MKIRRSSYLNNGIPFTGKITSLYWIKALVFAGLVKNQYSKPHCGDKTVVRSSYLNNGISFTGKITSLYWIRALVFAGLVENKLAIRILMNTALLIFPKQMFINSPRPEQNFWPFTVCFQKHLLETHCSYSLIQINCSPGTTKSALIPDIGAKQVSSHYQKEGYPISLTHIYVNMPDCFNAEI